jgi:integrase
MASLRDGVIRRGKTWSYVIRVTDSRGVSKPKWVGGFPTEASAKKARDSARVAASRGEYVHANRITVAEFLTGWLAVHALEVKPRTRAGYGELIDTYVVPHIGAVRLQSVKPATLSGLYRDLLTRGGKGGRPLSSRTVNHVHALLRKAFNDAVNTDQVLATNPASRAKRPRQEKGRDRIEVSWSADDLRRFLALVEDHRLFALYRLAAYTGARRGELLNLRWDDVTLDGPSPRVRITGTVQIIDSQLVAGTTKAGQSRVVSIDPGTVSVLRDHCARQEVEHARAMGSWVPGDLVFRREIGAPLYPSSPTQLMSKRIRDYNDALPEGAAPLPPVRFHDLRHVHATLLLRAGVPVHVVAKRLGHADPAVTLRTYAHVLADQAAEVATLFADLVDPDDA